MKTQNRFARFTGVFGAVLIVFGAIAAFTIGALQEPTRLLESATGVFTLLHLVAGLVMIVYWLFTFGGRELPGAGASLTGRTARFGYNAVLYGLVFVALLVLLNIFAARNVKRWDFTETGVYSLAPQSVAAVRNLKKPLKVVALVNVEGVSEEQLRQLLNLYQYEGKEQFRIEYLDPRSKPQTVDQYEMKAGNLLYLQYGEGDKAGVTRINEVSEEAITNAVIKLEKGEAKKIYYVDGHAEPGLEDQSDKGMSRLAETVKDEHFTLEPLVLAQKAAVPADAAAVILASPKKSLLPQEKEILIGYAESGGHLMMLTDPRAPADVREIAEHFNIKVNNDVIVDQVQSILGGGIRPLVRQYGVHPVTTGFSNRSLTIFPFASSLTIDGKNDDAIKYTEIAESSATSWGETNLAQLFDSDDPSASLDKEDRPGPLSVVVVYEKNLGAAKKPDAKDGQTAVSDDGDKTSRVMVVGTSAWLENDTLGVYSNRDLLVNSLNWLSGEQSAVAIQARTMRASLSPVPSETLLYLLAASFIIAEIILLVGLGVWWSRKTRFV